MNVKQARIPSSILPHRPVDAVPVIDIAPFIAGDPVGRAAVIEEVGQICRDIGFFMVSGHGLPDSLSDDVYRLSLEFFDLPDSEKLKFERPPGVFNRGYQPFRTRAVGRSLDPTLGPSLHDSFAIGMLDVPPNSYFSNPAAGNNFAPNIWPDRPADFEKALRAYYAGMSALAATILRIFAAALDLPGDFFESKTDKHISTLRLTHYPALMSAPNAGEERSGAHTDTGALTILRIDDAPGGLQVCSREGKWINVPYVPGTFVINIADMMMAWTNDAWISTLHRVVNPPSAAGDTGRRLSMPFFFQPNYDAVISCIESCMGPDNPPRHPPMTSGDYRKRREATTYSLS